MMMNIFSSFNPLNYFFLSYLVMNLFMLKKLWILLKENKFNYLLKFLKNFIYKDFNKTNMVNMYLNILMLIFIFNILINLINLLPFSFSLNSQLSIFFFFSLNLWFSCILYALNKFVNDFFIHLTPLGSPMIISPLMVLIELISLMIRPITLSVRMSANMLAGHVLIHLLTEFSFFLMNLSNLSMLITTFFLISLNILEMGVAVVQPYIFCTLINMYLVENN